MAFSSGTKTALGEAASWAVAGIMIAAGVFYYDDLKALISPVANMTRADVPHRQPSRRPTATNSSSATDSGSSGYMVRLNAGPYGHYKTSARINGRDVEVLVDTGASFVALTYEDAESAGIYINDSDYTHKTQTANGTTKVAMVQIDRISVGDIDVRNVRATVHEPGSLHVTLLGMSFLSKLRRAEMRNGQLVLEN